MLNYPLILIIFSYSLFIFHNFIVLSLEQEIIKILFADIATYFMLALFFSAIKFSPVYISHNFIMEFIDPETIILLLDEIFTDLTI